jgi:ABC-type uncharacterized transport system substrate-binding protein
MGIRFKIIPALLLILFFFWSCDIQNRSQVFYINSYHEGYGSSDDVMAGIKEVLGDKVDLRISFMDTKRNSDPGFIQNKVKEIINEIEVYQPDVIIASDDNAVKYVIEPHFKNGKIPVVYCGVNWSADQYELPRAHVTGMLEVLPFIETVEAVKQSLPVIARLTVLSENSDSERKNKEVMDGLFKELELEVTFSLVDDFESWKSQFIHANASSDIIYIPTNGAIKNWDVKEAKTFVKEHIQKPVITCDDFMMPYAVFGLTKVAKEQGEWAAQTALKILQGAKPADIPITENRQSQAWINTTLAEKVGFMIPEELKSNCKKISE